MFFSIFLACAAAQLDSDQFDALKSLWASLNCVAPRCPNFRRNESCPTLAGGDDALSCDAGRVTQVMLSSGLTGVVNGSALAVLTGLTLLDLSDNAWPTVPTEVGRLTALTLLSFSNSSVTGSLPSQVNNLSKLDGLFMHNNKLAGSLPELSRMTSLRFLFLQNNAGLNGRVPALPLSTRDLRLNNCSFTALPPNLSNLMLTRLQAYQNKLVGPPPVLTFPNCSLQFGSGETNCLDCPGNANNTVGRCACYRNTNANACATTTRTTTTNVTSNTILATTTATTTTTTTTTTTGTITMVSTSATTSTLQASITQIPGLEPWIVGVIVGGTLTALVVVGVAVFVMLKRKQQQAGAEPRENLSPEAAPRPQSPNQNYGFLPAARVYHEGRIDLDADSAESESLEGQYATVLPKAEELYKL
jgi:hypothetical protein